MKPFSQLRMLIMCSNSRSVEPSEGWFTYTHTHEVLGARSNSQQLIEMPLDHHKHGKKNIFYFETNECAKWQNHLLFLMVVLIWHAVNRLFVFCSPRTNSHSIADLSSCTHLTTGRCFKCRNRFVGDSLKRNKFDVGEKEINKIQRSHAYLLLSVLCFCWALSLLVSHSSSYSLYLFS